MASDQDKLFTERTTPPGGPEPLLVSCELSVLCSIHKKVVLFLENKAYNFFLVSSPTHRRHKLCLGFQTNTIPDKGNLHSCYIGLIVWRECWGIKKKKKRKLLELYYEHFQLPFTKNIVFKTAKCKVNISLFLWENWLY